MAEIRKAEYMFVEEKQCKTDETEIEKVHENGKM
jgi:hypothetical protein